MTAAQIAFPEPGDGTHDAAHGLPPLRDALEKDRLFPAHNAESRKEHPAFGHLQGLVAGVRFELTTFGL